MTILLVYMSTCAFIVPDKQLPFSIITPNTKIGEAGNSFVLKFKLNGFTSLTYGNVFAIGLSNQDFPVTSSACQITSNSLNVPLIPVTVPTNKGKAHCQYQGLDNTQLTFGDNVDLELRFTFPTTTNFGYVKAISLQIITSTDPGYIVLAEAPFFSSAVRYSETEINYDKFATINSLISTSISKCYNGSSSCLGIFPGANYGLELSFTINKLIDVEEMEFLIEFSSTSSITSSIAGSCAIDPGFFVFLYKPNAISLRFSKAIPASSQVVVKLSGFTAPIEIQTTLATLSLFWKNTYSRIGVLALPNITITPFPITFTQVDSNVADWQGIAHPEFFDIYENGAWPMKFIMNLPPLSQGGYLVIENLSNPSSIFKFVPSTCDFSEDVDGNALLVNSVGKRGSCYSNNLVDPDNSRSSIFFKVGNSEKIQTISVTVWGVAVKCSSDDMFSTNPTITNILSSSSPNSNSTKFKFNYKVYSQANQEGGTGIFNSKYLIAQSNDLSMYGRCLGSFITHFSTFPSTDIDPWNSDTRYVTGDGLNSKDVLLYSEIHDWNITKKSQVGKSINFIEETNNVYLGSLESSQDIEFGALSNKYNYFPKPNFQGTIALQLSRDYISAGSSPCYLQWFNNAQVEIGVNQGSNFISNDATLNLDSTQLIDTNGSILNATFVRSPSTFIAPIKIKSNTLSNNVLDMTGKSRFFLGSTLDLNLGFYTNCYQLRKVTSVKSIYTYIDFTYIHTRSNAVNRVGRFIKLFPSGQVFNNPGTSFKMSTNHALLHAFSTVNDNVCLLSIDGNVIQSAGNSYDTINIHLQNLRLLDQDYSEMSSYYPTSVNLVATADFSNLIYPFSHIVNSNAGQLNTPMKDCSVFSLSSMLGDDPFYCRCSTINPHPTCKINCSINSYHPFCFCSTIQPHPTCAVNCAVNVYHPNCNCNTLNPHITCPVDCLKKYQNFTLCNCLGPNPRSTCPINCNVNSNHPNCNCNGTNPHITCPIQCFRNPFHPKCQCYTANFHYTCVDLDCSFNSSYPKCNCNGVYPNINCPINCQANPNHIRCQCNIRRANAPHLTCTVDCNSNPFHPLCYCNPESNIGIIVPNITCPINCSYNSKHPSCNCTSINPHITCPINCNQNINHPNCNCNSLTVQPHITCPVNNCNVAATIRHPLCHCSSQNTTNSILPSISCTIDCSLNPFHPSCNCWTSGIVNSTCSINCQINPNHPSCDCNGIPHYTCPMDCSVNNKHPGCECAFSATNIFKNENCPIDCVNIPNDSRCACDSNNPHSSCPINCGSNNNHPLCDCWGQSPDISCWINCSINAAHPNCNCTLTNPHFTCPLNCSTNINHPKCFCAYYPNVNCAINCSLNSLHPNCHCNEVNVTPHATCVPLCNMNSTHPSCSCSSNSPHITCPIDCSNNAYHPSCNCSSETPHPSCTKDCTNNPYHQDCYCFSTIVIPNSNCPVDCTRNDLHASCNCRSLSPHNTCPIDCANKNINHPSCNCGSSNPHLSCPINCAVNASHPSCLCSSQNPHISCNVNCANNSYHPFCNCQDLNKIPHSTCSTNCAIYQTNTICQCESLVPASQPHISCPLNCTHNSNHPSCNCEAFYYTNRHPTCPFDCSVDNQWTNCNCNSNSPHITCTLDCSVNNNHPLCYCNSTDRVPSVFCPINCALNDMHPSCNCSSNDPTKSPHSSCPKNCIQNSLHPLCNCGSTNPDNSCPLNCNSNPNNILCGCAGDKSNCSINCQNNISHPYCFCSMIGYFPSSFCSVNCAAYPFHPNCNCSSTNFLLKPNNSCPVDCSVNDNHPLCNCTNTNSLVTIHPTCPINCSLYSLHPSCNCNSIITIPHFSCPVNCNSNNTHPYCYCNGAYPSIYCNINCSINRNHPSCNCDSNNVDIPPHITCPNINCAVNMYHPLCKCDSISPNITCTINCALNTNHPSCNCHSSNPHPTCIPECNTYPNHPKCFCNSSVNVDVNCPIICNVNPNHPYCNCDSLDPSIKPHSTCPINCVNNPNNNSCNCNSIYDTLPHVTCPIDCVINQYHPSCNCSSDSPHITCPKNCLLNNNHPLCYCYTNLSLTKPDDSCPINCSFNNLHSLCKCDSATPHYSCPINCTTNLYHPACNCFNTYPNLPIDLSCSPNCSLYPQHPICGCGGLNPHSTCTIDCSVNYYHPYCYCFVAIPSSINSPNTNCPINCFYNSYHPSCNCNGTNPDISCPINCLANNNHPSCRCSSTSPHLTCPINCSLNANHPSCNCLGTAPHSSCDINNCTNSYHPLCNCFRNDVSINQNCPLMCDIYTNHPSCHCSSNQTTTPPNINCPVNCITLSAFHPLCKCDSSSPHPSCSVNCMANSNHYLCRCTSTDPHPTCYNGQCLVNYYAPSCNCKSSTGTPNSICPIRCSLNQNHPSCKCGTSSPHETCPINCSTNNNHPYCNCATKPHITCPLDCNTQSPKHPSCQCNSTNPNSACPVNCTINPFHPSCNCDGIQGFTMNSNCYMNCSFVSSHPNCLCHSSSPDISCPLDCGNYSNHPLCGCNSSPRRLLAVLQLFPNINCPINCSNNSNHPMCKCDTYEAHSTCNLGCNSYPAQPACNCYSSTGTPNSNCPVNCSLNSNHVSCQCGTASQHITCPRNCTAYPAGNYCDCNGLYPHFTCSINCSINSAHPACHCTSSNSHPTCNLNCNTYPLQTSCNCFGSTGTPDVDCPINCSFNNRHPNCFCNSATPHSTCSVDCSFNDAHTLCHCNSGLSLPAPHKTCAPNCSIYPFHPDCKCGLVSLNQPHSTCPKNCSTNMYHPNCNCFTNAVVPDSSCPIQCGLYYKHPSCHCDDSTSVNIECPVNCANNSNHPKCNCTATALSSYIPHISCPIACNLYSKHPSCNCLGYDPHITCTKDCSVNYRHPHCFCFNPTTENLTDVACPINCQVNDKHPLCHCNSVDPQIKPHLTCSINCTLNSNHPKCNCEGLASFETHITCPINCSANANHYACRCWTWTPHITCPVDCSRNVLHPNCNCNDISLIPNINCPINCSVNSKHPSCNCTSNKPHITCPIDCNSNPYHSSCNCNSNSSIRPHYTCPVDCSLNSFHPNCNCTGFFPHVTCNMNCKTNSYHPLCKCYTTNEVPNNDCPVRCWVNSLHPQCNCSARVKGVPHSSCIKDCINNPFHPQCACSWSINPDRTCQPNCYINPYHYRCSCLGLAPHSSCPVNCYYNNNHSSCKCGTIFAHHTCPDQSDCTVNPFDSGCSCENINYLNISTCSAEKGVFSILKTLQNKKKKSLFNLYSYLGTKISFSKISFGRVSSSDLIQPNIVLPVVCPYKGNNRAYITPAISVYSYNSGSGISPGLNYSFTNFNSNDSRSTSSQFLTQITPGNDKNISSSYDLKFNSYYSTDPAESSKLLVFGDLARNCAKTAILLSPEIKLASLVSLNGTVSTFYTSSKFFYLNSVKYNTLVLNQYNSQQSMFSSNGSTFYNGLFKPDINTLTQSSLSFNCFSEDGNTYINKAQSPNINLTVDKYWNIGMTKHANINKYIQQDKTFAVNLTVHVPTQLSTSSNLILDTNLVNSNSICSIDKGDTDFSVPCTTSNNNVTCQVSNTSTLTIPSYIKLCCLNIALDKVDATFYSTSQLTNSGLLFSKLGNSDLVLSLDANLANEVTRAAIVPLIKSYSFSQSTNKLGLGIIYFTVNLTKPAFPNQRVRIASNFNSIFIKDDVPECGFAYNSDASTNFTLNMNIQDMLVDKCIISKDATTSITNIDLYNKNQIFKCGLVTNSTVVIRLSPVYLNVLASDVNTYNIITSLGTFDKLNSVSADATPLQFPSYLFSTTIVAESNDSLCNVVSISPNILGHSAAILFNFDLTKVVSTENINELTVFLRSSFYDRLDNLVCYVDDSLVPCRLKDSGFLNIAYDKALSKSTHNVLVRNIISGANDVHSFDCSANKYDSYTEERISIVVGRGINNFKTIVPSTVGLILNNNYSLNIKTGETFSPRSTTVLNLDFAYDLTQNYSQGFPDFIPSDGSFPALLIELPNDYPLDYVKTQQINANVHLVSEDQEQKDIVFKIKSVNVEGRLILIIFNEDKISIPKLTTVTVNLTNILTPYTPIQTGIFKMSLLNDYQNPTLIYTNNNNLNAFSPEEHTPYGQFTRGFKYAYPDVNASALLQGIDIIDGTLINSIEVYQGRYKKVIASFASKVFPVDYAATISLEDGSIFKILGGSVILTNINYTSDLMIGVSCGYMQGVYFVKFVSNNTNVLPIGPIRANVLSIKSSYGIIQFGLNSNNANNSGTYQMTAGGEFKLFLIANSIPIEALNIVPVISNDSLSTSIIKESSISLAAGSLFTSFTFQIKDSTIIKAQSVTLSFKENKCFRFNSSLDLSTQLVFNPSLTAPIINSIDIASILSYNSNSQIPDSSLSINIKGVPFTKLYCSLYCSDLPGPTTQQMISRPSLKSELTAQDLYYSFDDDNSITHNFDNLKRGQSFNLKCVLTDKLVIPNTIEKIFSKLPVKVISPTGSTDQATVQYQELTTVSLSEPKSINLKTTNGLSKAITDAIVRSMQTKYENQGLIFSDSNGFIVKGTEKQAFSCYDESLAKTGNLRFLQAATSSSSPILVTASPSNDYYLYVEESYTAKQSISSSLTDIVTIVSSKDKLNAEISKFTSEAVTENPVVKALSDVYLDNSYLILPSTPLTFSNPNILLSIKYPLLANQKAVCSWKATADTTALLSKDSIQTCPTLATSSAPQNCGKFDLIPSTNQVGLPTGRLANGTYSVHIYCTNELSYSKYFIQKNIGSFTFKDDTTTPTSSVSSALSSSFITASTILMAILTTILA